MLKFLPTRAQIMAGMAALIAALIAFIRHDAKRQAQKDHQLKDYEHADEIDTRVARHRNDPERLRKYEGRGWRD